MCEWHMSHIWLYDLKIIRFFLQKSPIKEPIFWNRDLWFEGVTCTCFTHVSYDVCCNSHMCHDVCCMCLVWFTHTHTHTCIHVMWLYICIMMFVACVSFDSHTHTHTHAYMSCDYVYVSWCLLQFTHVSYDVCCTCIAMFVALHTCVMMFVAQVSCASHTHTHTPMHTCHVSIHMCYTHTHTHAYVSCDYTYVLHTHTHTCIHVMWLYTCITHTHTHPCIRVMWVYTVRVAHVTCATCHDTWVKWKNDHDTCHVVTWHVSCDYTQCELHM